MKSTCHGPSLVVAISRDGVVLTNVLCPLQKPDIRIYAVIITSSTETLISTLATIA